MELTIAKDGKVAYKRDKKDSHVNLSIELSSFNGDNFDPGGRAERSREWRKKNKEYYQDWQLLRTYGLPLGDYKKLLAAQDGKCAICKSSDPGGKGKFHVDHCHETSRIRGLLCRGCNVGIGSLKHDSSILQAAIEYLNRT